MQLKANGIGGKAHAGQPRPLQRVLAFFDVLLRRAPDVIECEHPLVRQAAIGNQEADGWEQFAWMELDLGDDAPGLRPALGAVVEAGVAAHDVVRRSASWPSGQERHLLMQFGVAFDPDGTIEDLVAHWERKVSVIYDSGTGLIDLRVLAFDPEDARTIAEALLAECTEMINALSAIAREDAIKYARDELEVSVDRLKDARRVLTEFRNRTQIVDPSIDTQNQMGLLVTLQQQQAEALIELDLLRDTTQASDPRITQAERRVEVIEERIQAERRKLGIGNAEEGGIAFADLVGEYEGLIVEREFAEAAYTSALATFDAAQAEARKQSRYLAPHIRPTLAEKAEYPERIKIFLLAGFFMFFSWAILVLVYYSLRDRS